MKYELKDPDADLTEFLAREFSVNFIRARNVARKISFDLFVDNYGILESLVGENIAKDIVEKGSFLDYRNGTLDEYFKLVMKNIIKVKENKAPLFYSIEALKSQYNGNSPDFDINKLNLAKNKLFHSDDAQAKLYLNSLISYGSLTVSTDEHWTKSRNGEDGPRSFHILKKVDHLLKLAFADLGLERPQTKLNNNAVTLEINEKSRENLRKIKEALESKS